MAKKKACQRPGCNNSPKFNVKGSKSGKYCSVHIIGDMVDVVSPKCKYPGCEVQSSFNIIGLKSPDFCKEHKTPEMVNVVTKRCEYLGCDTIPVFNLKGLKTARFCSEHKDDNMVNIREPTCNNTECLKIASYNKKGTNKPIFCAEHKSPEMINIFIKTCENENCDTVPYYNIKGEKKGRFCQQHALEGMVDVKNKTCVEPNCGVRRRYGPLFGLKLHCTQHKKAGEYAVNKPKCEKCGARPLYSDTNYPKRCDVHKLDSDSNIVEKPCKNCNITQFIKNSGDTCTYCLDYKNDKIQKAKEIRIKQVFDANKIKYEAHDKIVEGGCSRYRPDFVIPCGQLKIIVEVDENQHSSYAQECEQIRMLQIFQDFGGAQILFIRYNPDGYIDDKGKKNTISGNKREKILLNMIADIKGRIEKGEEFGHMLAVTYIAYDGWNGDIKINTLEYKNN